jgi:hypothetical protein
MKLYKQQFPNKYPTAQILLANLKSNGIKYNCEREFRGVKGVYTGVIRKTFNNDNEDEDDEIKNLKMKLDDANRAIVEKDKKIKELQKQLDEIRFIGFSQEPKNEVIKETITDVKETIDEDSEDKDDVEEIIYNKKKYFKDKEDNIYEWINEDVGEFIGKFVNEQVILNKTVDKVICENEVIEETTTDIEETTDLDEDSEEECELVIYNNEKYYKGSKDNIYKYDEEEVGELIGIFVNGEVILNKKEQLEEQSKEDIDNFMDEFCTKKS